MIPARTSIAVTAANGKVAFIRFSDATWDIFTINPDGTGQTNLSTGTNSCLAYSPDGSKMAFAKYLDGWNICVMNADGSNLRQLTFNTALVDFEINCPAWSPDGSKIAFISTFFGNASSLIVMNADGSQPTIIYYGSDFGRPSWSPDGTRIAFPGGIAVDPAGTFFLFGVVVINANGSGATIIAYNAGGRGYSGTMWSLDGTEILYGRVQGQDPTAFPTITNLYLVNPTTGNLTQLTNTPANDFDPVWSPDGTMIAFGTDRNRILCTPGGAPDCEEIFLMNADGSNQHRIASAPVLGSVSDWQSLTPKAVLPPSPARVQFKAPEFRSPENIGGAVITVTRLGDLTGEATVDYSTTDGSASQRSDYTPVFGTLRFAPGQGDKTFTIPIIDNALVQGDRTVNLRLSNAQGALLGGSTNVSLTITDNDTAPPTTNPLDTVQFFVRQHYYDFLNRVPDQNGFNFWTNQITQCGSDQQCVEIKRINVSAAFFLSIEFQEAGYLVYRTYKAAYGSLPGAPVPIRFNEFLPDTEQIGQGVVVGQSGWEQALETNKQNFMTSFVQRSRFTSAFPTSMTVQQFVDALYTNAGLVPTSAPNRPKAISEFNSTTPADPAARARALRDVAEDSMLTQQEFNRAFVLMQYFGYLRRNPNDPPDSDFSGYNFWLGKLNQFGGNYQAAEMVKAFIVSTEYRQRFGQP